jgi:iron complex transport system ATP-binding protein
VIALEAVRRGFGDLAVLDGVDLTVERGEFVGLVGPNGAGKTTLLRTVNGLLAPDGGTVRLDGDPVTSLGSRAVSRRVATVPQDAHLGFAFTAEQIVEMGRTPHHSRLDWSLTGDAVDRAFERTGTEHLRERRVDELSGGERQRILLARALAQEAPALLLDEPTASLDVNHQVRVLERVRDLVADGRAALAAIHDLDLAARYCDRLVLLADGHIRARGSPAAVLSDEALSSAFQATTAVTEDPVTGTPRVTALSGRTDRDSHVHVVGSGRSAASALAALWRAGFAVSLGPVPRGDVAAETGAALAEEVVRTEPYSAPAPATTAAVADLAAAADTCLLLPGPERDLVASALADVRGVVDLGGDGETDVPDPAALVDTALGAVDRPPAAADD